jgi:deoxyadenosine/deoxycytidine kinase
MIVWISGPTGAGKSSLAGILSALGCGLVKEQLPEERFRAFVSDPVGHCALLQKEIMVSRFERWQQLSRFPLVMFDRSIDEDARVFCWMHRELGLLDDQQNERLQDLARKLQSEIPNPDLILYICPGREILAERVKEPTYPSVIVGNLDRQLSLYSEWLASRREEILRVDNSACSLRTLQRLFSRRTLC